MIDTEAKGGFRLDEEPAKLRDAYGRNRFGQGCLLARRLVERGVSFVEVTLDGWDTHPHNFDAVKTLSETLDPAFATLLADLKDRGMLANTLVVWMGEFGRTPLINPQTGRDHFPLAWSTVLAGAGVKGGQAIGSTGKDGADGRGAAGRRRGLPRHRLHGRRRRPDDREPHVGRPAHPARQGRQGRRGAGR